MTHNHYHFLDVKASRQVLDTRSKLIGLFIIVLGGSFLVDIAQVFWYFLLFLLLLPILRPKKTFIKQMVYTFPLIFSLSLISFFSFDPPIFSNFLYEAVHTKSSFALFTASRSIILVSFILMIVNSEESFFEIIYGLDDMKLSGLLTYLLFLSFHFFNFIQ